MANRWFTQFFQTLHKVPVLIDFNFIVDSTNGNGLGIRSLKGPGVASVIGYTSATPATGNNMAQGYFQITLQDNYNRFFIGNWGAVSPLTGSNVNVTSGLNVGGAYTIVSVGTTTQAEWITLGLLPGNVPAVGTSFIAATATAGTGTGVVQLSNTSNVLAIELIGDPNQTLNPQGQANLPSGPTGASYIVKCLGLPSSGQTPAVTQPANGTTFAFTAYLSNHTGTTAGVG